MTTTIAEEQASGINRREFMGLAVASAVTLAVGELALPHEAFAALSKSPVPSALPPLPWANNALEPTITANTLSFHYGKHHAGYLTNLNNLLNDANSKVAQKLKGKTLEEIIIATFNKKDATSIAIYRNSAQVYNHAFYWNSLSPTGGGSAKGDIATLINNSFTDFATFRSKLIDASVAQFGTGWAWVVVDKKNKLQIISTGDADTPITTSGVTPLLTIDVWEHAYYLDYKNLRKTYVTNVIDKLLNWDFANKNLLAI